MHFIRYQKYSFISFMGKINGIKMKYYMNFLNDVIIYTYIANYILKQKKIKKFKSNNIKNSIREFYEF